MAAPHEFCAAIFPDPGPWFPVYRKGTRRIASLVQVESIGPDGSQAASLGNVEMIDSTNRFALSPLSRCSQGRAARLWIWSFVPCTFCQSASYVPCTRDEPTRPRCARSPSQHSGGWGPAACFSFSSFVSCICSAGVHQSSPHRCAEPPFQGWLFRFAASRPVGSLATGNFNGKWWNDRFFESILPSHRYRGVPEGEHLLTDFLICYGYVLAVSLICTGQRTPPANRQSHFRLAGA